MTKFVAASVVCLLPLLAACPGDTSPCVRLGNDVLVEVTKASAAENVGDCKVPPAFRLAALGCSTAVTPSADLCDVKYELLCRGDVTIELEVKQLQDDGIEGKLHKVDMDFPGSTWNGDAEEEAEPVLRCSLDLDIVVKSAPAPKPAVDDE